MARPGRIVTASNAVAAGVLAAGILIPTAFFDRHDRGLFLYILGMWPVLAVQSPFAALFMICIAIGQWLNPSPLVGEAGGWLVAGIVGLVLSLPTLASLAWVVWLTFHRSTWRAAAILSVWLLNTLGWWWFLRGIGDID